MSGKRIRRIAATAAVVLFVPGGAQAALAETEASPRAATASVARDQDTAGAVRRQQRAENAWLAEQLRAAGRGRQPPRG